MTLQHIGRCRLLLQRLPQLVEQPRVLDGDNRLRGEVLHQSDLLIGKRPDLLAVDDDGADQPVLVEHRHGDKRPRTAELCRRPPGLALAASSAMWITSCPHQAIETASGFGLKPATLQEMLGM